jgi:hypothetical protein
LFCFVCFLAANSSENDFSDLGCSLA